MFSVNTISVVMCLCAILHPSESRRHRHNNKKKVNSHDVLIRLTGEDKKEIVDCHNDIRRNVKPSAADMMKMIWSEKAAANAREVAALCTMNHSPPSSRYINGEEMCGENLYFSSHLDSWTEAIKKWEEECNDFTYGVGGNGKAVGHYTQVVWASTDKVGCARAKCDNLDYPYLFVCQYCIAGNLWGQLHTPYETGKSCSKCKGRCENKLCV